MKPAARLCRRRHYEFTGEVRFHSAFAHSVLMKSSVSCHFDLLVSEQTMQVILHQQKNVSGTVDRAPVVAAECASNTAVHPLAAAPNVVSPPLPTTDCSLYLNVMGMPHSYSEKNIFSMAAESSSGDDQDDSFAEASRRACRSRGRS